MADSAREARKPLPNRCMTSAFSARRRARAKMSATLASSEGWMPNTQRRAPFTAPTMPEKTTKTRRPRQANIMGRDQRSQVL